MRQSIITLHRGVQYQRLRPNETSPISVTSKLFYFYSFIRYFQFVFKNLFHSIKHSRWSHKHRTRRIPVHYHSGIFLSLLYLFYLVHIAIHQDYLDCSSSEMVYIIFSLLLCFKQSSNSALNNVFSIFRFESNIVIFEGA
jgi:hypothetical protein